MGAITSLVNLVVAAVRGGLTSRWLWTMTAVPGDKRRSLQDPNTLAPTLPVRPASAAPSGVKKRGVGHPQMRNGFRQLGGPFALVFPREGG